MSRSVEVGEKQNTALKIKSTLRNKVFVWFMSWPFGDGLKRKKWDAKCKGSADGTDAYHICANVSITKDNERFR